MSSKRVLCKTKNCRKWKNLGENGFCPLHLSSNLAEAQNQDVCKCIDCNLIVNDNDHAVNCELCEEWCHVQCTDISQDLYEKLDPKDAVTASGLKWFCAICLPKICVLLVNYKKKPHCTTNEFRRFSG